MTRYLSNENGEVLCEFNDTDRIVAYDYLNIKRKTIENKLFYKLYKDSVLVFMNDYINPRLFKTFFGLVRLLDFNTNEFVSFNGIPANIGQLCKHFKMNSKTFYNHIRKLQGLEIVAKVKNGRDVNILINPYFIGYGVDQTDEALKMFINSAWAKNSVYSKRKKRKKEENYGKR